METHTGIVGFVGVQLLPPINTSYDLMSYISSFIDSGYNGDLIDNKTYVGGWGFQNFLKHISSMDVFPTDILVGSNKTVEEILTEKEI